MSAPRMVVESDTMQLDPAEFEAAWTALELVEFPLVLKLVAHGETLEEQSLILHRARTALIRRRLWVEGRGPLPRLASMLFTLHRADTELDVRASGTHGTWRALVARTAESTVLAVHRDGVLSITQISEHSLPAAVLSTLPTVGAARGQLSAPTAKLKELATATGGDPYRLGRALQRLGTTERDAVSLVPALLGAPGVAKIGGATREPGRLRRRCPRTVSLVDTDAGRYLLTERGSPNADPWTTMAPAEPLRVHTALRELLGDSGQV